MQHAQAGLLALADGTLYHGTSVGVPGSLCGEVVFNTAQTGYQEILTDPSYHGQIIVFTQPHIGNVGINAEDMESKKVHASGVILHSLSMTASNWRSELTLTEFLKKENVIALSNIDTRALTHHLRDFGSQSACLTISGMEPSKAVQNAKNWAGVLGKNLASIVSTTYPYTWGENTTGPHVVVYDFGVKHSILNCLAVRGCKVTVVPATTSFHELLALNPDGVLLSNGPGDPAACHDYITVIKELLQQAIPMMGICLGHQLLALACGAKTKKMMFGHHGANHPIQHMTTGIVSISSQNHGFVVAENDLPPNLHVTHRSLFDGTIAGFKHTSLPVFGFQGHPEASPGPTELLRLFDDFIALMEVYHA